MRMTRRASMPPAEMDMTPMIDMTFQLIAFFMVLLSFSEAEMSELIKLPSSVLAKPPDGPTESPLTLQLTERGTVLLAGAEVPVEALGPRLEQERTVLERLGKNPAEATVIIRADAFAPTGDVQQLIKSCQENGFVRFVLRAKQEQRG
ncbi:MAG: biopolymer transporter ExbD [Pirellulales bacterium]|nr:biopolymer transporter ExbD [Pirellulales bacterium]